MTSSLPEAKVPNPKDQAASARLSLSLVPATLPAFAALAFTEGALKYGSYNWRRAPVRASVYRDAAQRHLDKFWNGEWADEKTGVPHLASVLASCGIILDAWCCATLIDDRPPAIDIAGLYSGFEPIVAGLQAQFKDYKPAHQYLEADPPK